MIMKAVVFLVEGFEPIEAVTPIDILRRGGVTVTTVSLTDNLYVDGGHGITIKSDKLFQEIENEQFELYILPGGPGTDNYFKYNEFLNLIKEKYGEKKLIAAICAAPKVLAHLGILDNKKATCYPTVEKNLVDSELTKSAVEVDGNIITSRGAGTAMEFSFKLLEILCGKECAKDIQEKIMLYVIRK